MIRRILARTFWFFSPWKLKTAPAPGRPSIFIGAPHTSNWDFVLMLAVAWRLGIHIRWMGKSELFTGWKGPVMRRLGGIPVDRQNPAGLVAEVVAQLRSGKNLSLVITPDGTRKGHTHWKSGFYRIARESGLPVVLAYVDRTTMSAGLGPTLELTGDVQADMDRIREFYRDKAGFRPEHKIEPRLRNETNSSGITDVA